MTLNSNRWGVDIRDMLRSRHPGRSLVLVVCLLTSACSTESEAPCGGAGVERLRCRAERSNDPEAERLFEVLSELPGSGAGRQTTR